ncbi:MAG: NAD(P)/FAD-dependent oxidoreductase [Desulfobacterium sp.]|nr:NAD(P)/FAD-dependent oxidoreductase [Desulfobacterium sp.]
MSSTIMVGSGVNGLLLGALLSHEGDKVTVFEKNKAVGGRAILKEKDGYVIDNGLHVTRFGPLSAVAKVMDRMNRHVEYKKVGESFLIDHDGKTVLFPTRLGGMFKTGLFSFREKIKIVGLISKIKRGKFNHLMHLSLGDWMAQHNVTGGIRRYFELVSASLMVCPFVEKTSAGEMFRTLHKILNCNHSVEYPQQGWLPIFNGCIDEIKTNGDIKLNSKVDRVIVKDKKAIGVMVNGESFYADRVIINLPVQELFSVLSEEMFEADYVSLCKNLIPTSGVFIDIAIKKRISDIDGMIYTYAPKALGMITSNIAEGLTPENGQLLTMWYPTSLEDVIDPGMREKKLEELWGAIRRFFPDIDENIHWKREKALKIVDGAQINIHQTEDLRPAAKVPGIEQLFLVGDSIAAPGAGGDVGNESVLVTFEAITGKTL